MKILGIGNAIIDVICKVEESFLKKNNLTNHILVFDAFKTELRKSRILVNRNCINRC